MQVRGRSFVQLLELSRPVQHILSARHHLLTRSCHMKTIRASIWGPLPDSLSIRIVMRGSKQPFSRLLPAWTSRVSIPPLPSRSFLLRVPSGLLLLTPSVLLGLKADALHNFPVFLSILSVRFAFYTYLFVESVARRVHFTAVNAFAQIRLKHSIIISYVLYTLKFPYSCSRSIDPENVIRSELYVRMPPPQPWTVR